MFYSRTYHPYTRFLFCLYHNIIDLPFQLYGDTCGSRRSRNTTAMVRYNSANT
jgi:hypothetical protein